ncbi:MAG: ABC transporter substrate-binding protein [Candidatus Aminicenantaceae bacterium]
MKSLKSNKKQIFLVLVLVCFGVVVSIFFTKIEQKRAPSEKEKTEFAKSGVKTKSPNRIICAAPSVVEIVFALGCGDQVVGISHFSKYIPETKTKANIGGLINPNKELIIALQPDLLITQGKHESLEKLCREKDIQFITLTIETLEDITKVIAFLGEELDAEDQAKRIIKKINSELAEVKARTMDIQKRKTFLVIGHTPGSLSGIMTTGSRTFLNELIDISGGKNIFSDTSRKYPQISKEAIIKREPDIIIEVFPGGLSPEKKKLLYEDWKKLFSLTSLEKKHIHLLTEDYLLIPGIRVAQTAEEFTQIIHPELYNEQNNH